MAQLTDLADALRAAGLRVIEQPGWQGRGHGPMSGVRGVLCHHTAGGGPNDWQVVQNGRAGLAGPLAHLTLERDGSFRAIAAGECWHAGTGTHPAVGTNNGNTWLVGIEGVSRGVGNDWTAAQRTAYVQGVAALLRHYGLGADRAIFHREWARPVGRKIDPEGLDAPTFRRDVARILAGHDLVPTRKAIPTMIDRPFEQFTGSRSGRIVCPIGSASAIVARAWLNVSADGGVRVQAWFQKSAPGSDATAPGTGAPIDWTLKNAERGVVEIPSGTEFIQYTITDPEGPGTVAVELQAR